MQHRHIRRFTDPERCNVRMIHLDRVMRAKAGAINETTVERLAQTYKVMGDPTRLKIVIALRDGEMCVCDIAAAIGLSESAVSHQLRRLRDLYLVCARREGQVLYYALDDDHVLDLVNIGLDHIDDMDDTR